MAGLALAFTVGLAVWRLQPFQGPAPRDVAYQLIDGRRLTPADLEGRPVLVSFWSTTCAVCLREIPHLKALHREASPRGLVMIAVAMPYDPPSEVLDVARREALPYHVALDVQGRVLAAFGRVPGTPTHFLVDGAGQVVLHWVGALDTSRVLELMEDPAAGAASPG